MRQRLKVFCLVLLGVFLKEEMHEEMHEELDLSDDCMIEGCLLPDAKKEKVFQMS